MPSIRCPLHRPELHSLLTSGEATIRQAMGSPIARGAGEVLISTGEEGKTVYLLAAGWVALSESRCAERPRLDRAESSTETRQRSIW